MQINISTQIQQLQKQLENSFGLQKQHPQSIQTPTQNESNQNCNYLSKMQSVIKIFINSLKLNQKLYNSITQKQSKIQLQTNSFFHITSQTDIKIQDILKRTKQLYEDTVHQNQKARFMLQQFISPIRQQLKSKVDETTFTLQMKMLLDQYDVMGHQITYDVSQEQKVKEQKRKSVNSQTLSFLRDRIMPVISHIQNKLQQNLGKSESIFNRLDESDKITKHLQSELNLQRQIVKQNQVKILQMISQRISDEVIEKKIRYYIKAIMTSYTQDISGQIQKSNRLYKNIQFNLTAQLQQIKSSISSLLSDKNITDVFFKTQLEKQSQLLESQHNSIKKQSIQLKNIIDRLPEYEKNIIFVNKFYKEFGELSSKVKKGEFEYQQGFKGEQFQIVIKKLNDFQIQSKKIKKFQKQAEERNLIFKGELQGVRDMLSKKANFSDILMHFQNKVDKQEFKQFKQLIGQGKDFKMNANKSVVMRESQYFQSSKKRSVRSRSFFSPSHGEKQLSSELESQQVRRFKLGFNSEFFLPPDGLKKQYSKTQHLRTSIMNNSSSLANQMTQN